MHHNCRDSTMDTGIAARHLTHILLYIYVTALDELHCIHDVTSHWSTCLTSAYIYILVACWRTTPYGLARSGGQ